MHVRSNLRAHPELGTKPLASRIRQIHIILSKVREKKKRINEKKVITIAVENLHVDPGLSAKSLTSCVGQENVILPVDK